MRTAETGGNRATSVWVGLMRLGALTGCHQKHERSFHIMGFQFPLCARCTGLLAGQLAGLSAFISMPLRAVSSIALAIPAAISVFALGTDGLGQFLGYWASNNRRRFFTGFFCGFFTAAFYAKALMVLLCQLRKPFP